MTEMHDVVELLLNRMKDYPEDFVGEPDDYTAMVENKWRKALRLVGSVVAPHEREALDIRMEEARRAVYMGAALNTILSTDEELEKERPQLFHGKFTTTGGGIDLSTPSQISLTNTIMNNYTTQIEQRQKELDYQSAINTMKDLLG